MSPLILGLCFTLVLRSTEATSSGALTGACTSLVPGHGVSSQPIPGGYYLHSDLIDAGGNYAANTAYTVTLTGETNNFKGFLIQARAQGTTTTIGSFSTPSGSKHLNCGASSQASVTHTNSNDKSTMTFTWTSPSTSGTVRFVYTCVKVMSQIYVAIDSSVYRPPVVSTANSVSTAAPSTAAPSIAAPSTAGPVNPSTTSSSSTVPVVNPSSSTSGTSTSATVMSTGTPSSCPSTNKNADSSFPITFHHPVGCQRENCLLYWAMGPNNQNSDYLDVYMEGDVQGWIGLGFSHDQLMRNTDVLGCRIVGGNTVDVVDGWNSNDGPKINSLDPTQDGVCVHMTEYSSGKRLQCLFSRSTAMLDSNDFDLDDSLYIIRGYRNESNFDDAFLYYHTETPSVTTQQFNPMEDTYTNSPTSTAGCPAAPSGNAEYPTKFGNPGDDFHFGARVNDQDSNYLDIILEGEADGWVGVGFSETKTMHGSDVFVCKRELNTDTVNVIDTWNPTDTRTNVLDFSQDGLCQHSTEYSDGRIKCIFSRMIQTNDTRDLQLDDNLYQIYRAGGSGRGSSESAVGKHTDTPTLSDDTYSVSYDAVHGRELSAINWPKKALIQTHGVFMIVSWVLLAGTGIFFASWMKPILPNGEWFQTHRALMIGSLVFGVIGFIFAFIAHARNTQVAGIINFDGPYKEKKYIHFIFGWLVILFHIANPIIALVRCAPGKPKRWIFNLIHGHLVGLIVFILALVNIGIGIYLIEQTQGTYDGVRALWVYIIFLVVTVLLQVTMFIWYTYKAKTAPEEDSKKIAPSVIKWCLREPEKSNESVKMTDVTKGDLQKSEKSNDDKPPKKTPVDDAPVLFGWIGTGIHLATVITVVLVVIILIAIL